jgi:hypothetical protein
MISAFHCEQIYISLILEGPIYYRLPKNAFLSLFKTTASFDSNHIKWIALLLIKKIARGSSTLFGFFLITFKGSVWICTIHRNTRGWRHGICSPQ